MFILKSVSGDSDWSMVHFPLFRREIPTSQDDEILLQFPCAFEFILSQRLTHTLHSLVRVSRRGDFEHFVCDLEYATSLARVNAYLNSLVYEKSYAGREL